MAVRMPSTDLVLVTGATGYIGGRLVPRRWILPVPVLTPRLSSLWIHLVTPPHRRRIEQSLPEVENGETRWAKV